MTKLLSVMANGLATCICLAALLGTCTPEAKAYEGRQWTYQLNGHAGKFTRQSTTVIEDSAYGHRYTFTVHSEDANQITLYDAARKMFVKFEGGQAWGTLPNGREYQYLYKLKVAR